MKYGMAIIYCGTLSNHAVLLSFAGIVHQSEKFPVRFIVELLNKQCRIVLTGKVHRIGPLWGYCYDIIYHH